jgi:UDP-glucose 4-epimerase
MKILVTGGAGYIGGFMVKKLLDLGHEVAIADSLERGHEGLIDDRAVFRQGNLLDDSFVNSLFVNSNYDAVMHFAAYIAVEESMKNPGAYFQNNIFTTVKLLDAMQKHNAKYFIFSSTGTVYGTPTKLPIPEDHAKSPENPYAQSKLMVEQILHWYFQIYGIGYAVLRYFNAAGGALDGSMGENHTPETHLIPNAVKAAMNAQAFSLFGDDYNTPDGTCIRDYIHVLDLIDAHISTLQKLSESNGEYIYNVGTGKGSTNKEVIDMVKKVSGVDFPVEIRPRREGDVAEMVADTTKIQTELNFSPKYSDLETIVKTAWAWHKSRSNLH